LEGPVLRLGFRVVGEVGIQVLLFPLGVVPGLANEDFVVRPKGVIHAPEILVLPNDVWNRATRVDGIEDVSRIQSRQRLVVIDVLLRILVDSVSWDNVRNSSCAIAEGLTCQRVEDNNGSTDRNSVANQRRQQSGEVPVTKCLRIPVCLLNNFSGFAPPLIV